MTEAGDNPRLSGIRQPDIPKIFLKGWDDL